MQREKGTSFPRMQRSAAALVQRRRHESSSTLNVPSSTASRCTINRPTHMHAVTFITRLLAKRRALLGSAVDSAMEIPSVVSVLALLTATLVAVVLFNFLAGTYKQLTYWSKRKVPYVRSVPVLGPAWRFILRRITFTEYAENIYYSHPNTRYVAMMDYVTPTLALTDPQLIREVMVKSFDHFTDHRAFLTEEIEPLFSKNVFMLKGERWRDMRNILSPSFTANKMKFMFELIARCSQQFVDCVHENAEGTLCVEAKDTFARYTNDVIATVAFGVDVNSVKDPTNDFFVRGKDVFRSIFNGMFKFFLIRVCPGLLKLFGITVIPKATTNFFRTVIAETLKTRSEQGIVRPDMLHLLAQAKDKESSSSSDHKMTVDDIASQAFLFFLAGFDSTSNLMSYMAYELALHQDIQDRLRDEVDGLMEKLDGRMEYDSLVGMEYMDMVMAETLRKYPGVIFMDRVCTKTYEFPPAGDSYNSATLYPGEILWIPIYSLHHDPRYYPDPDKFDPERFSQENKAKIVPYTYLPFGAGPRKCIGDRFALMETKILMAHFLRQFILKPVEKTQVPLKFMKSSLTLMPEAGIWLGLEKRSI